MNRMRVGCVGWLYGIDNEYGHTTAVCDIDRAHVEGFTSKRPSVKGYTDYRAMLDTGEIDVVLIATPNEFHQEMAEYALKAGVHVFLEKPMGVNREELDSILRTQQASGRQLAIDFELRVSFFGRRVKEIIDSGEIGKPVGVEFVHHRGAWLARGNNVWRTDPNRSGGLYFMEVCHEIDVFRHWFGEIAAAQSFSFPNVLPQYRDGMPDNVCTHLWFREGVRGVILTSHTSSVWQAEKTAYRENGHDMVFIVTGTEGAIRIDCIDHTLLVCRYADFHPDAHRGLRVERDRLEDHRSMSATEFHHDTRGNLDRFIRSMALDEPPHQDATDAWRTHVICLAAEESARDASQRIEIDYTLPS